MIFIQRVSNPSFNRCHGAFAHSRRCNIPNNFKKPSASLSAPTKNDSSPSSPSLSFPTMVIRPLADIRESQDSAILSLDVPGFNLENLTIDLDYNDNRKSGEGGVLYVTGSRTNRLGRKFEFNRRFALNKVSNASLDTIAANLSDDGVLEIVVPKTEEVEPLKKTRVIPITIMPTKQTKLQTQNETYNSSPADASSEAFLLDPSSKPTPSNSEMETNPETRVDDNVVVETVEETEDVADTATAHAKPTETVNEQQEGAVIEATAAAAPDSPEVKDEEDKSLNVKNVDKVREDQNELKEESNDDWEDVATSG